MKQMHKIKNAAKLLFFIFFKIMALTTCHDITTRSSLFRWCTVVSATFNFKYDEPEVKNVTSGCSLSATFSTSGSSYLNVARTTVLHLFCRMTNHYNKISFLSFIFNFHQQLGERRSTPLARWRYNIQRLHSNKLKCKFLFYFDFSSIFICAWSIFHILRLLTEWPFWL